MIQEVIIKNMVCPRCIKAVSRIFENMKIPVIDIKLGTIRIRDEISIEQKEALKERLIEHGFELLNNKHSQLINRIKSLIIQEIHYQDESSLVNFSTLLIQNIRYDYAYLSRLFSQVEGQTIERFVMSQKIEKVKELLTYNEMNLSEIAFQMNYSSSAHLSNQFKKITGMTPSAFKKLYHQERKPLDTL